MRRMFWEGKTYTLSSRYTLCLTIPACLSALIYADCYRLYSLRLDDWPYMPTYIVSMYIHL